MFEQAAVPCNEDALLFGRDAYQFRVAGALQAGFPKHLNNGFDYARVGPMGHVDCSFPRIRYSKKGKQIWPAETRPSVLVLGLRYGTLDRAPLRSGPKQELKHNRRFQRSIQPMSLSIQCEFTQRMLHRRCQRTTAQTTNICNSMCYQADLSRELGCVIGRHLKNVDYVAVSS
jgi:hypothetical protein